MKKLLTILVAVVLVASSCFALVACGDNGSANFEVPEGGYDGSPVTIEFYSSMGQNYDQVFDTWLEAFNELYPNITVNHTRVGGYDDVRNKISTEIKNGQAPNIAYCYADHVAMYNRSKKVVQLDNLINSTEPITYEDGTTGILGLTQEQKDDFVEGYYAEGEAFGDGHMYLLPFIKSTELMYINDKFFTDNDLPIPDHWFAEDGEIGTASADTTSMEYVLYKIKEIDGNCIPLGYDSESNWFITLCEQAGSGYTSATGDHYIFDNAENRKMMDTLNRWYQDTMITTPTLASVNYCSSLFTALGNTAQKCYICIGSSAGATNQRPAVNSDGSYPFDVRIESIPQIDPDNPKVISQGPSICIFQNENPQEVVASWLLLKFLTTTPELQAEFAAVGGYTPSIKSAREVDFYKTILDKRNGGTYISGLAAYKCVEQSDAYFSSPVFYGSSTARDEVGKLLQTCFLIDRKTENVAQKLAEAFKYSVDECKYAG